jgi:hypothetical protein
MSVNEQRRQKKLERKRTNRNAERRIIAQRQAGGMVAELSRYSSAPVLHCFVQSNLWATGIGAVLICRELTGGRVAFANFLVDVFCLGVKDAFAEITPRSHYQTNVYERLAQHRPLTRVSPSHVRKLVEEAVAYARRLGLEPHPDYRLAQQLFGDIDVADCPETFTFGKDGKPFFVSGPFDSPARCHQIMSILGRTCGEGNFHYLMEMSHGELNELEFLEGEQDSDAVLNGHESAA